MGSLGQLLAIKFMKVVHYPTIWIMADLVHHYLFEFMHSYEVFTHIYNLQFKTESLHKGPGWDNNSIVFEFSQTNFLNQFELASMQGPIESALNGYTRPYQDEQTNEPSKEEDWETDAD